MSDNQNQPGALKRIFGCDVRSLAIFRIALGITILTDLFSRWSTLEAMYTDNGYYTRQLSYDYYATRFGEGWDTVFWSIHWLSGSVPFQSMLFVVAGIFATLLIFGAWTRVATAVSWVLLISLHVRNPVILSSGDFLLKLLLFWSMFIPLGKVWSIDAKRAGRSINNTPLTVTSFATAGIIIQLFSMYFFTGLAKWNDTWWSGDAMYYVLHLDIYVTEFGRQLLDQPLLLQATSYATVIIEVFLIALLFSPWKTSWFRMINLVVYWGFHIGIAMAMQIGIFPLVSMVAWLLLIPGGLWNVICKPEESRGVPQESKPVAGIVRRMTFVSQAFCAGMIVFVLMWNVTNIESPDLRKYRPSFLSKLGYCFVINQHFQMFGTPPNTNVWFVYDAELEDGTKIDVYRNEPVRHELPASVRETFPAHHWRRLHRNLVVDFYKDLRQPMVDYLVKKWNREHAEEQHVSKLKMLCYFQETGPGYEAKDHAVVIFGTYRDEEKPGSLFDKFSKEIGKDLDGFGF